MTLDKVKLKTINNQSVIGDGNITVGGSSVDIVTSWSSTTSDSKVPSEKLTKNSLDDKISKSQTTGLVKNDGSIDTTSYLSSSDIGSSSSTSSSKIVACNDSRLSDARTPTSHTHTKSQITDFPTIPSKTSDLTNDGSSSGDSLVYVETSSTSGLLKNDGSVDTSSYIEASDISFGFDTNTKEIYIEVN